MQRFLLKLKKNNMDVRINFMPETFTLLGISYQKMNLLVEEHIKVCHEISIGILLITIDINIYEKGSV